METRTETDSFGTLELPADAYYGIHTARSLENFPISGRRVPLPLIRAYALVKKAAALTNRDLGLLHAKLAEAIAHAADELADGPLAEHVVVDLFQMGAGTSLNMNVNEVLANRAAELLGHTRGATDVVHPNDHVNLAQSTNDTYPTAMRIAARVEAGKLLPALDALAEALAAKAVEFDAFVKSARTHLQDAVPIRLGQEFAGYAAAIRKARRLVAEASVEIEELGLGGTAAGTGLNAHPDYPYRAVTLLRQWTGINFRNAPDLREAMQSNLPIARVSGSLRDLALELIRLANDLRLLSSGPNTGLAEIALPPILPGSSIMPGKVNPSLAEMLNMVCFQVIGNDHTIALAVQAGQLELNVMMPIMAPNLLESIQILTNALAIFTECCVKGIEADEQRCRQYAEASLALATALAPLLGYDRCAEIAKRSRQTGETLLSIIQREKLLTPDELREALDPRRMTEPRFDDEQ